MGDVESSKEKRWAKKQMLAELRELFRWGFGCNVQEWYRNGTVKKNAERCAQRRAESRRLLRLAIAAVEGA